MVIVNHHSNSQSIRRETCLGGMPTARGGHGPATFESPSMPLQSRGHATLLVRSRQYLARGLRPLLMVWLVLVVMTSGERLLAEDASDSPLPKKLATENPAKDADETRDRKERSAIVGGFLLLLLVIVSVSAVALLAIWGRRTRRLARQPLPKTSELDPMWYLRKPNRSSSESEDSTPQE